MNKKSSENEKKKVIFRTSFSFFSPSHNPKSEIKKSRKSTNKKKIGLIHMENWMYVYIAERPFQCELYGKRFKQKHHLKSHHVHIKDLMNVHEGERPYE